MGANAANSAPWRRDAVTTAAILATVSAIWIETDVYRFSAGGMLLFALYFYVRHDFWRFDRVRIGIPGFVCLAWAIYVGVRYVLTALDADNWSLGTAEGVYMLPAVYATMGYALLLARPSMRWLIGGFIIATSGFLAAGLGTVLTNADIADDAVFANNTIHMSFGLGFVLLIHLYLLLYGRALLRDLPVAIWLVYGLVGLNLALCTTYILMLNSKGVWLALLAALAWVCVDVVLRRRDRRGPLIAAGVLVLVAAVAFISMDRLDRVAGTTAESAIELTDDIMAEGFSAALEDAIDDPSTPESVSVRMQLLADSVAIAAQRPWVGHGPGWLTAWDDRQYQDHDFIALHNSYLEIAMRFGLLGLVFYASIFGWAFLQMRRAKREGLVWHALPATALVIGIYFLVGAATNSHVRLAQGESMMLVFAAVGFYCNYLRQRAGNVNVRTWL